MQVSGLSGYTVKYRAYVGGRWLPWVIGLEDYAGIFGQAIEAIQVEIVSGSSTGSSGGAIDVTYQVYSGGKWLPNVTNLSDYAGIYGQAIQGVYANLSSGSIKYRTHTQGGDWLPWVTDRSDYAGSLSKNADGIQMQVSGLSGYTVKYRAYVGGRWLPWVIGLEDYAGIFGQAIEAIQVEIVSGSSTGSDGGDPILPPVTGARKVFIDPGHGGSDPGAIGNGLNEKDVVLSISKKVGNILTLNGISVAYSRTSDNYVGLENRAQQANNWGASLFVSVHANSFSGSARGTECYTYPNTDAKNIELSRNVAGAVSNSLGIPNRGHKTADFAVLRLTNMPAILVETAFISDSSDASLLRNNQDAFAAAIANQILKYFGAPTDGSGTTDYSEFYKYASNAGLFKGLGLSLQGDKKVLIADLGLSPRIKVEAELALNAKLPHNGAANHIKISDGPEKISQQLINQLSTAKVKIPFTKTELALTLNSLCMTNEINDNISYSIKNTVKENVTITEITLEASIKYQNITGYQRLIVTLERRKGMDFVTIPILTNIPVSEYNKLPSYPTNGDLAGVTGNRFKDVDWGKIGKGVLTGLVIACISVIVVAAVVYLAPIVAGFGASLGVYALMLKEIFAH
ncbi:N-acetylmuramoyl-L-alanine amidase [Clostridium sp. BL8]|nr:N-acetylmuramoyl-L-alanine amidase [Clostridium sp. BL8]EQB86359.1 N-acetylmuramoyl-L-alanine amidase [Clostridium sp. BL8]